MNYDFLTTVSLESRPMIDRLMHIEVTACDYIKSSLIFVVKTQTFRTLCPFILTWKFAIIQVAFSLIRIELKSSMENSAFQNTSKSPLSLVFMFLDRQFRRFCILWCLVSVYIFCEFNIICIYRCRYGAF